MNDTDCRFFAGICAFIIIVVGSLIAWSILHNDKCSICDKELNNRKIMYIHASKDIHFKACENCIWEAFKDKLK